MKWGTLESRLVVRVDRSRGEGVDVRLIALTLFFQLLKDSSIASDVEPFGACSETSIGKAAALDDVARLGWGAVDAWVQLFDVGAVL